MGREANHEAMVRETQKIPEDTQKRAGRYPEFYTGELFLETLKKPKAPFKPYFDSRYRQLHLPEILKDIDKEVDSPPKYDKYTYNGMSTICIKFVFGHCSYGTRCCFKHVPGRYLPKKYTT